MLRSLSLGCASLIFGASFCYATQLNGTATFPGPSGTPSTNLFTENSYAGGRSDLIWLGSGINAGNYPLSLWSNYPSTPAGVVAAVPGVTIGNTYYTGYATISAVLRGAGLYSFSVTGSGGGTDLMSALYVAPNVRSAFNPTNNMQNLIMTNDDSQGTNSASDPYKLFYQNASAACTTLTLVTYNWNAAAGTANYNVSGPGQIATSCAALGPDATNTLAALRGLSQSTQEAIVASATRLASLLSYDTNTFGKLDWSLAFAGRYSDLASSRNEGAGALIAAKRITPNVRVGAFVDAPGTAFAQQGPLKASSALTLGGFAVYEARPDLVGWSGRFSVAYTTGKMTSTRDNVAAYTEPGSGRSTLAGRAIAADMSYGIRATDMLVMQPFIGLQRFEVTRFGYSEGATATVTYPLTYGDYGEQLTTAVTGLRFLGQVSRFRFFANVGGEFDVRSRFDDFAGSSNINGLGSFSIVSPQRPSRTRLASGAGFAYEIERMQLLSAQLDVRQQAYSRSPGTTSLIKYSVGF